MDRPFVVDAGLTAIAIGFHNPASSYIADNVLPRLPVTSEKFKWTLYPLGEAFNVPDARVGRRGRVQQLEFSGTEQTDAVDDFGFDSPIPNSDIDSARQARVRGVAAFDPEGHAVMMGKSVGKSVEGAMIAGGLVGGIVGNLFKKAKYGTSTLTGNDKDDISVTGNSSGAKKTATGLGGAVQDGIAQIAEALGGAIGDYQVLIGTYKDKYRVSTTGFSGKLGKQGSKTEALGIRDFGKDGEADAVAFAIMDGGIKGLSGAVQKALQSNTDVNDAVAEALKVQEVETLLGGIGAQFKNAFNDLERQAKERVRIARDYGFDVVAIEKKNAEDRVKLTDGLLKEQVGSLQRLVDEMKSGSLFEGSAIDQRTALLASIETAKSDLNAGKDGAGDTLANLYQQLDSVSKDAFGTTGQFAADRASIFNDAQAAIARTNAQIVSASAVKSDPALTVTNKTLDENNDQNAEVITLLKQLIAQKQPVSGNGSLLNLATLARTS